LRRRRRRRRRLIIVGLEFKDKRMPR